MRIHEILIESQQLDEGPKLDAFGRGVGQVVGGVAKGVGAVAGGVRGAFTALKKGYQSGKAVVGDDPDPGAGAPGYTAPVDPAARPVNTAPVADPKAAPAPVADPNAAPAPTPPPTAKDINAAGPDGTALAKPQTGAAGAALAKTDAVTDKQTSTKAGETVYAQVKANIDKLDKKGKQRILQLLQKSMATPDPKPTAGAPKPGAAPAPAGGAPAADPAAAPANTMANAPVSATNTADPSNPNLAQPAADAAAPAADPAAGQGAFANVAQQLAKPAGRAQGGGKVAGELSQNPRAVKRRADRAAAAAAKQPAAVTASLVHHGKSLNEVLAQKLEMHKRRMFESALSQGTASVFVK